MRRGFVIIRKPFQKLFYHRFRIIQIIEIHASPFEGFYKRFRHPVTLWRIGDHIPGDCRDALSGLLGFKNDCPFLFGGPPPPSLGRGDYVDCLMAIPRQIAG